MQQTAKQEATTASGFSTIHGAPEGQDARVLAAKAHELAKERKVLVHIALDDTRMAALHDLLEFFAPDVQVINFPAWDCLPYDRVSPNAEIVAQRVHALTGLLEWQKSDKFLPRILLTTVNAVLQRVTPRAALKEASFIAAKGERIDLDALQSFMEHNGYQRTETVREAGEYAMRGGIIDLFPPGYEKPVRLDLFGDEIEKIRCFDAMSQRSTRSLYAR